MAKQLQTALLRKKDVLASACISNATLYNLMASGSFPRPVHVGLRSVRWVAAEVQAYIDQCIARRDASALARGEMLDGSDLP